MRRTFPLKRTSDTILTMGKENEKKTCGIVAKLAKMTLEEKTAYYKERELRRKQIMSSKREEIQEWKQETLKMLTSRLKQMELNFGDGSQPISQAALWIIHDLLKKGFSVTDLRDRILADEVTDSDGWDRIKKALFGEHISKIEDLGIDVFTSQNMVRETIKKQIRYLEQMKKRRPDDPSIPDRIGALCFKLHEVERSLMKDLGAIGVVGEKNKKGLGAIHIHTSIPRPLAAVEHAPPQAIDVTPKKVAVPA